MGCGQGSTSALKSCLRSSAPAPPLLALATEWKMTERPFTQLPSWTALSQGQASAKGINRKVTSYSLNDEGAGGEAWEGTGNPSLWLSEPFLQYEGGPQAQAFIHMPPNRRFLYFEYFFLWPLHIWIF